MHTNLREIYGWTLQKYKKYDARLKRNLKSGRFYELSLRKQNQLLARVDRLKNRLRQLKLQLKVAVATGIVSTTLALAPAKAQQLGPFVSNEEDNPFRSTEVTGQDKKITFADIDNDGDIDFAMGLYDGTIEYYENVGDQNSPSYVQRTGTANPFDALTTVSDLAAPELVDFDGDGDYDLILGEAYRYPNSAVSFYLNDDFETDGIVGNAPNFSLVTSPGSPIDGVGTTKYNIKLAVVDIDGDGDLDIILGKNGGVPDYQSLVFFENNSGFTAQPLFAGLGQFDFDTSSQFNAPTFNDIDGDGDLDLLLGTSGGNIRLFRNTDIDPSDPGDTTIGDDIAFTEQFSTNNPFDGVNEGNHSVISFADLDNDGDEDAVIGQQNGFDSPAYFENTPSGFVRQNGLNNPFDNFDVGFDASPTFVDIDDDGDLDAVIGSKYGNDLFLLENEGGVFTDLTGTGTAFDNLGVGLMSTSPEFILADNDADFDMFVGSYYDPSVIYFRNTGRADAATFLDRGGIVNLPVIFDSDSSPTFGDLNGDGLEDIIVGFDNQGQMRYFEGVTPQPTFTAEITGASSPVDGLSAGTVGQPRHAKPKLIDLDHDGDLDLAVGVHGGSSEPYDGRIAYFRNDGSANFVPLTGTNNPFDGIQAGILGGETGDSEPTFADLDLDGDQDMFVGTASGLIEYFENQNVAPTVNLSTSSIDYDENDGPVVVDPALQLVDDTSDIINKAEIIIVNNYEAGIDVLDFTSQFGITGVFESAEGLLRLEGAATRGQYQAALRTVTYENSSEDPQISSKDIEFYVTDYDNTDPQLANVSVDAINIVITSINDFPVVTTNTNIVTFTEGEAPVRVDQALIVTDPDNTELTAAEVTITEGFSALDRLEFSNQNGISGSYDASTGVLALTGTASIADYETALRSVAFNNISSNPSTLDRTINFSVSDGQGFGPLNFSIVEVVPVNDAPIITSDNSGSINYQQNAMPVIVDNEISVFDEDDIDLESLQISILGFVSGDVLDITEPTGLSKNFDTQTGILTITGTASLSDYGTAMLSASFSSSNGAGSRQIEFIANDGELDSNPFVRDITLFDEGNNEPPTVVPSPQSTQTGSTISINLEDIISDPDNSFDELDISIVSIASGALASITGNILTIDYAGLTFEGLDNIILEACDPFGACDQNSIEVTVQPEGGLIEVFNAVSPNNDNANDYLEIVNITSPNTVEIYNRWGDLVYEISDYNNSTVRFEGRSNRGSSEELASGTYFYSIKTASQTVTGYLVLKK